MRAKWEILEVGCGIGVGAIKSCFVRGYWGRSHGAAAGVVKLIGGSHKIFRAQL